MREPNAIAFAGDWHGNTTWGVGTLNRLADDGVDTIVHTGDYGYTFTKLFVDSIEMALAKNNQILYFVDGNHDCHDWIWNHELDADGFYVISKHVRAIPRAHRWNWWGLTFVGLGGAVSVDRQWRTPMVEWWPTEQITPNDLEKALNGGMVDVMIAHDCPTEIPIPGISMEGGLVNGFPMQELLTAEYHRQLFREIVNEIKPRLYVHGHYHVSAFGRYKDSDLNLVVASLDMDSTSYQKNIMLARSLDELEGIMSCPEPYGPN